MPLLHIGDHTHLGLWPLLTHLVEPDHVFFAVLTVAVGVCAYRYGRKVEARLRTRDQGDRR